jgi:hypothetical protein
MPGILFPLAICASFAWSISIMAANHQNELKCYEASYNAELKKLHVKNLELQAELEKECAESKTIGLIAATVTSLAVIGPAVIESLKEMR